MHKSLEHIGDLLERKYTLNFLYKLTGILLHMVKEDSGLLERKEFVCIPTQYARQMECKHAAKVKRPYAALVKTWLVLRLYPASLVT